MLQEIANFYKMLLEIEKCLRNVAMTKTFLKMLLQI